MPGTLLDRAEQFKTAGFAQAQAGRPTQARRLFERGLVLLDGSPDIHRAQDDLRVRVLLGLSAVTVDLVSVPAALDLLERAAGYARDSTDDALLPLIDVQRGDLLARDGRSDEALRCLDAAAAHLGDLLIDNQCALLLNRGILHLDRGNLRRAQRDFSDCADIARRGDLPEMEFKARSNLGWTQFLAGHIAAALQTMESASEMEVDVERGILIMDRARVLTEAGLVREAETALVEAEAEFVRLHRTHDRADAELARAECALIAGDPARAAALARRAAARFRRRGSDWWAAVATLTALHAQVGSGLLRGGEFAAGVALREEFAARGQPARARAAALICAELLIVRGETVRAGHLVGEGGGPRGSDRIGLRMQAGVVSAGLALARGDSRSARRVITRGIGEVAAHQSRFGSLDLRTSAAIHGTRLMQLRVDLALADGRPAEVFDAAEHVRSISSRLPGVRPPDDDRTADLLAELRGIVEVLRGADVADADSLRRRRVALETAVAARTWTYDAERTLGRAGQSRARYPQVRAELRATGTEMVSYVRSGGELLAVVAGPGRGRVVRLADSGEVREVLGRVRADLDALSVARLPPALWAVVAASLARNLSWVDDRMVRPLRLQGRRLVVIAGGAAATVPWNCLPSLVGVPVSVAPSATWWLRTRRAADNGHLPRGGPRVVTLAGPGLARSADEAAAVADVWPGSTCLLGEQATAAALATALGTADLVHVAAHGRHETQNPLFSSVRLADGVLFAHELGHAQRSAGHVVLSACDLGLATIRPGDEALGLTSVLLHHGTRTVIAGVARVGDEVAAETMMSYHRVLAGGLPADEALAGVVAVRAGTAWSDGGPGPAPFVCFGATGVGGN